MFKTTSAALLVLALAAAPAVATSQSKTLQQVDPSARASYGDYRLNAGFPDDPYIIYVTAGRGRTMVILTLPCRRPMDRRRCAAASRPIRTGSG